MSVYSEINRIVSAKNKIKNHLVSLGVANGNESLSELALIIESLGTGKGVLSAISIDGPLKKVYELGETLDLKGIGVTALYDGKNVTAASLFSPSNGSKLTAIGDIEIEASYTEKGVTKRAKTSILVNAPVPSWSDGSWNDIADAIDAHRRGEINLYDYWNIGDYRTVSLQSMPNTYVNETQPQQDVDLVLIGKDNYIDTDGQKCVFVVQTKDTLVNTGRFSTVTTYSGMQYGSKWENSDRRSWCNEIFKSALPSELQNIIKEVVVKTNVFAGGGVQETNDHVFLASYTDVGYSGYGEGDVLDYFNDTSNTIKSKVWFLRTNPYNRHQVYAVPKKGRVGNNAESPTQNLNYGISPCFCI